MSGTGPDTPLRVLVIEDNVAHARFVRSVLELMDRRVEVHPAGRVSSACERLRDEPFDFVIADLHLPDAQGPAVVVRLLEASPSVPVLVVSALDDPSLAQLAMAAGAHDYLTKDRLTPELLAHAMVRAGQRTAAVTPATGGVLLDPATGVFSARGIELAASKTIAFARRHRHPVNVVHIEARGTPEEVAELVRIVAGTVRDADLVGRLGSERLVVILPDDRSDPPAVLGRVSARVAASAVADIEVCIEVRRFDPEDPVSSADLLRVAAAGPSATSERLRRALVVSGDPLLVDEAREALGGGWIVMHASGLGPAARLAALEEPHLAIVDLAVGAEGGAGGGGLAVVRGIAQQAEAAGLPIIGILPGDGEGMATGRGDGMVARVARNRLAGELGYVAERAVR